LFETFDKGSRGTSSRRAGEVIKNVFKSVNLGGKETNIPLEDMGDKEGNRACHVDENEGKFGGK